MAQIIYTDGANAKSINPWDVDSNPEAWTWLSGAPQAELDNMFYKVAASFRAVNKRAISAANVPFQIMKGETVVNDSTYWDTEADGGFIRKPKDLIKRISLSLTFTNAAYLMLGKNAAGVPKGLNFLVPTTIRPVVNGAGDVDYYERIVNGKTERIPASERRLIKIWLLDHTTETLPSKHTAAQAMFNSAGGIYFQDLFIRNFFERGGVKPTVLALKGAIFSDKKEEIENRWSRFLRNLSRTSSKILNADTMDVKAIGAGVDDLKNNEVYQQAISNIALSVGMPVSELLSDFDSFATAQVDRMSWLRDDIFPLCEAIAEDLNLQVFEPMDLRLDFLTETSDAETQDEVDRAEAYQIYTTAGIKPSVAARMVGIELPDGVEYEELDGEKEGAEGAEGTMGTAGGEGVQQQALNGAQVASLIEVLTLVATGQLPRESGIEVIVASFPVDKETAERMMGKIGQGFEPEEAAAEVTQPPAAGPDGKPLPVAAPKKPVPPTKWIPTLDEYKELDVWREVAMRRFKKSESLDFEYQPHYGGLPDPLTFSIRTALLSAASVDEIKAAFEIRLDNVDVTPAPEYKSDDIRYLANALNNFAATKATVTGQPTRQPASVIINNSNNKMSNLRRLSLAEVFAQSAFKSKIGETEDATNPDQ